MEEKAVTARSAQDVWTSFGERLRRFIASRVRNAHDVDDVVQEVFARIHAGLDSVERPEAMESWLFQVARRAVVDHYRKRASAGIPVELRFEPSDNPAPNDVASEVASWLEPLMELLDEPDREALRLVDLEGLGQKELAARLGLSVTGAKSRVQRARARLKKVLTDCCAIELDRRGNAIGYTPRDCTSCSCG
jgi:RNA polymerase sigma-70 factor, ECF subfamily